MTSAQRHHAPLVALALVVVALGIFVSALLINGGAKSQPLPATGAGPTLVSQAQLARLAAATDHPLYWAGPRKGYSYELTRTAGGRTYIRYLPGGVRAGDPRPNFLVIGTYAQSDSYAYLKRAGRAEDEISLDIGNGGLALFSAARTTNVYFTYPGAKYEVEVFDPSGDSARRLVLGGKIAPLR